MTEDQIERAIERKMDRLDKKLLNRELTEAEYKNEVARLDSWGELQLRRAT